jgi:hypothetical protein
LTEQAQIDTAAHWVLGRKGIFLNTVGDVNILPRVFDAAERFVHAPSEVGHGTIAQIATNGTVVRRLILANDVEHNDVRRTYK